MGKLVAVLLVVGTALAVWVGVDRWMHRPDVGVERPLLTREQAARELLYRELQPVRLANCTLQRYGEPHDGGYLMCGNLLDDVASAYSYGIDGFDGWGCDISRQHGIRVHQYDCFNPTEPECPAGDTIFHPECIGPSTEADAGGRPFDTLARQVVRNGDAGRRLVVKMDVEGSEWESVLAAPDAVLAEIDQLAIELHGVEREVQRKLDTVLRLKQFFHVAHLHFNNFSCKAGIEPFPAEAHEVLLVSKRLAVLDADQSPVPRPHPLDTPTSPERPDCQYAR